MSKCPVCGSKGEDLVFKFYCSNVGCQNFHKLSQPKNTVTNEVTLILHNLWEKHCTVETEEEFLIKFFANGGHFKIDPETKDLHIFYPKWLKIRMINE